MTNTDEEKSKFKVHIEGRLYLEADKYQYIVKKYNTKKDKDGNYGYTVVGYFADLSQLVNLKKNENIKESTVQELHELKAVVEKAKDDAIRLYGDVKSKILNIVEGE